MRIALTSSPSCPRAAPFLVQGPVEGAFALAAELGYDGVELHLRRPEDVDREEMRRLSQHYGLGIPTLGTGMAAGMDGLTFGDPDADIRRRAVERIRAQIALAAELGAAVTIGLIRGRWGESDRQARRADFLDCLQECCEIAAPLGVSLLLEPLNRYDGDCLYTVDEVLGVIAELGAPNLHLLADTFHMNIEEGDMAAAIHRAGAQLGHVHLVDSNRLAPGYGHLDMRGILRALQAIGFDGYLSFEAPPLPEPRRAAEEGIRFVRELLVQL